MKQKTCCKHMRCWMDPKESKFQKSSSLVVLPRTIAFFFWKFGNLHLYQQAEQVLPHCHSIILVK